MLFSKWFVSLVLVILLVSVLVLGSYSLVWASSPSTYLGITATTDDLVPPLEIGGIALIPIIMVIVNWMKSRGMPSGYAPWASLLLWCVAGALVVAVQQFPNIYDYVLMFFKVLVLFLSTAGLYETRKYNSEQAERDKAAKKGFQPYN